MLDVIDSGCSFDLVRCKADRTRKTAGELRVHKNWTKAKFETLPDIILHKNGFRKPTDPKHSEHKTRNIYNPATQEIKKIYIKLVTQFNGKRVVL